MVNSKKKDEVSNSSKSNSHQKSINIYPRIPTEQSSDDGGEGDVGDILNLPKISDVKREEDQFFQSLLTIGKGIYKGTINKKSLREGQGTFSVNNNKEYYSGEWKDDKYNGFGYNSKDEESTIFHGKFEKGILKEGYGKVMLADGYVYEGKIEDEKFHGLGSLTIRIKGLRDINPPHAEKECLRVIADWKEGKTKKSFTYLNEIEEYYQYQFEHFSRNLESFVLLNRENYQKQRDCLQTLIELHRKSDSDMHLLREIDIQENLPPEMKLAADFLLRLDSSHTALGNYTEINSKKNYRNYLSHIWQRELKAYVRRLVWSDDENFHDRISPKKIFDEDLNSFLTKSEVSDLKRILYLNPSVVQLIRKLVHFANERLNRINSQYRSDFLRFHRRWIQNLWKDYFKTLDYRSGPQSFDENNEKKYQLYSDCYSNILELSFLSQLTIEVELITNRESISIKVKLNEKEIPLESGEHFNQRMFVLVFDQIDQKKKYEETFDFSSDSNTIANLQSFFNDRINPNDIFLLMTSSDASQYLTYEIQEFLKQLGSTEIHLVYNYKNWIFMKRKNSTEKYEQISFSYRAPLCMRENFRLNLNDNPTEQNYEIESVIYNVMTFALEHLKPWENLDIEKWFSYLNERVHQQISIKEIGDHLLKKILEDGKKGLHCCQEGQSFSKDFKSIIDYYWDNLVKDPNLNYQNKTKEIKRIFIYFIQISQKANSEFENLIPTQLESIKTFIEGKQTIVELIDYFLNFNTEFCQFSQTFDKHFSIQMHEQFHQLCKEILSLLTKIFQMNLINEKNVQANTSEILKKYRCTDLAVALRMAVFQGNIVDTKAILELVVDVNGIGLDSGETALHWAVREKNNDLISVLLEKGADIHIKNKENLSPNDCAKQVGINLDSLLDQIANLKKENLNPFENRLYTLQKTINFLTNLRSLDFTWYVEGEQIADLGLNLFQKIEGKNFYRVLDLAKAKTKVKQPSPPHYVLQAIRELLNLIKNAQILSLAMPTRMIRLRGELIMGIEKSLKYFRDQIKYNSLEQFRNDCVSPFADVIKDNQSHQSFSQKLEKLELYFLYNRKLKEITVKQALELFEKKNLILPGKKEIQEAFSEYETFFKNYLSQFIAKTISIAKIIEQTREAAKKSIFDRKSIPEILAGLAIVFSLTNSDFLEKNSTGEYVPKKEFNEEYLLQPHCIQILGVLMILDINGQSQSLPPNHFAEILTGQGKSWALALLAGYFSLNGYRVTVACYSDYLSQRDKKDFQKNFDAFRFPNEVEYKTFETMCDEKLTYKNKNLRDIILDIISGKDLSPLKRKENEQSNQSILLVDEVDIFFSKNFGEVYRAAVSIPNSNIETIQKEIWQQIIVEKNRDKTKLFDCINEKFSKVINDDQMLSRLKKLGFLKFHLEEMIQIAIGIHEDMTKENLLRDKYKLIDEKINKKNGDGKYVLHIINSYENSFYYLKLIYEKENKFNEIQSIGDNFGYIYIVYGVISYSEIPNSYCGIFGVSGSLKELSKGEQSLLGYYQIDKKSYYPSFFGNSKLIFNSSTDFLITESQDDWFENIKTSVRKQMASERSVLIFFENETLLDKFYTCYSGDLSGVIPYFVTLNKIFDGKEEKRYSDLGLNQLITDQYAGHHGKVTLLTKDFGRGVDFQTETSVNEKGGIHVIQTFFSLDVKEEIQIKGRTARKDESGSYQLILCLDHLQELPSNAGQGLSFKTVTKSTTYEQLDEMRKEKVDSFCTTKLEQIKENKDVHQHTLDFLERAITRCNNDNREEFITEIHNTKH
jgi:hypothetical protein